MATGNTPPVSFGKPQMDAFANKQQQLHHNDFSIEGGDQDLGLVGRTIQNGGGSNGVQSFYSSIIH